MKPRCHQAAPGAAPDETALSAGRPITDVDRVFEALADRTRRRVVQLLSEGPHRAGEIAASARISGPAMSRHLRILLEAGIIADERPPGDARVRVFHLRPDSMTALQAWLDQLKAHWDQQLRSFQRHVEESRSR